MKARVDRDLQHRAYAKALSVEKLLSHLSSMPIRDPLSFRVGISFQDFSALLQGIAVPTLKTSRRLGEDDAPLKHSSNV
jgi:hypothetical protein